MEYDIKNANIRGELYEANGTTRWSPTGSRARGRKVYDIEDCPECSGHLVKRPGKSTPHEQTVIYECIDARTDCNFDFERLL